MIFLDFFNFVLHLDSNLTNLVNLYGSWIYPLLFLTIFCETGLVVTPFLPGDSLIFAAGALASRGLLSLFYLFLILFAAAMLGDNANYWIGRFIGPRVFKEKSRVFKHEYLMRTKAFYRKHGVKTIILARFVPIIRTFSPFVAGVGSMYYLKFLLFDILGALAWIILFLFSGFFFGSLPIIRDNFTLMIIAIIILSLIPLVIEIKKTMRHKR